MMFLRILGVWLLLLAMVAAVMDATKSLAGGGEWIVTPLLEQWASLSPATLAAVKAVVEANVGSFFWDPVLTEILKSPTWGVFGVLGLLLYWVGRRRAPKEVFIN
jgi:MYXO-CTERM domain-containing protein